MLALLLISSIFGACHCVPIPDDSADTTTTAALSTGPVDFDAFDQDLDDVYKSLAKIKSKASKLELIGPKIQDAMLHLAGSEEDVAKTLQAKYQQILPLLQQLKIDDAVTQKAAEANRRRRDVTSEATATELTVADATGSTDAATESINTDATTDVTGESATDATTSATDATTSATDDTTSATDATTSATESASTVTVDDVSSSSTLAPSTSTSA